MSRLQRHILFWVGYVLFKTYLNVSDHPDVPLSTYGTILLTQLTFLIAKVPVVYFCFFVIDKYLDMKWSLLKSIFVLGDTMILGVITMSLLNHSVVYPMILQKPNNDSLISFRSLLYHSFTLTFVVGLAVSIRLFRRQTRSKMKELELQKEKTETELKYLRAQINPHFLFNTLNNIYSLSLKNSPQTSEAVMKLSNIMRYILFVSRNKTHPLQQEITLISDYISLEMLRYSDKLDCKYTHDVCDTHYRIAPLIMMHFVENAFKHGVSESRERSFVNIDITMKQDYVLHFNISNSKAISNYSRGLSLGLENIRKQLNILYPGHQLTIDDREDVYSVELVIDISKK